MMMMIIFSFSSFNTRHSNEANYQQKELPPNYAIVTSHEGKEDEERVRIPFITRRCHFFWNNFLCSYHIIPTNQSVHMYNINSRDVMSLLLKCLSVMNVSAKVIIMVYQMLQTKMCPPRKLESMLTLLLMYHLSCHIISSNHYKRS
jgi:hypothetical protein